MLSIFVLGHVTWTVCDKGVAYDIFYIMQSNNSGPPRTSVSMSEYVDLARQAKHDMYVTAFEALLGGTMAILSAVFFAVAARSSNIRYRAM